MPTIQEHIPFAPYTTLKVGGLARYFVEVASVDDAREAIAFAREKNLPIFVLGGGSNIVLCDDGFSGLVILNSIKKFVTESQGKQTIVRAGAGEEWDTVVERTVAQGLSGLESLSGIPGRVGAAPVQNIGAYGASVASAIVAVHALDLTTGEEKIFSNAECEFAYRDSMFKSMYAGRYLITEVAFALTSNGMPNISGYHDLEKYFTGRPAPSLAEFRNAVIEIRARKGMVIRPEYESYRSVGSFFMNPIIPAAQFEKVKVAVEAEQESSAPWFWEQGAMVKVSAARLIERAGFPKGFRDGAVGISPKHTLAIIATDGATAGDVVRFARKIQDTVEEKFGVLLKPEAQCVGFATSPLRA